VADVARIGAEVAASNADAVDRDARFPREVFDALRNEHLLSVLVPGRFGGACVSISDVALAVEALSRYCASSGMILAMHHIQVMGIVRHGRTSWLEDYMRELVRNEYLFGSATTEKGIGGDVRSSICAVERDGDTFTLEKDAPVISYGNDADAIFATARTTPESETNDQVLVVVPKTEGTLEITHPWDAIGFRGTCSDGFVLRARGDVDQILSDPYAEISAATMLPSAHVLWASVWLGLATSAVDIARARVRAEARKKPGTTPPSAIRLADLIGTLESFRGLVRRGTAMYSDALADDGALDGLGFAIQMNALKTAASDLVVDIVGRALMVCGIDGYREHSQYALGRHLRDSYGAMLMVNNDRLLAASAQMLLIHRDES
jgi:acyl-CoA dehydrogenase